MSRTASKFLRDMWRHLAAMSLALGLMALAFLLLEWASIRSAPCPPNEECAATEGASGRSKTIDLDWLRD